MGSFKIKEIMFIDDDEIVKMVGTKVLKRINYTNEISYFSNGLEALENILYRINNNEIKVENDPILILLDINMPKMDAWEFMNEFTLLTPEIKDKFKIVIVTSSFNPEDKSKAFSYEEIEDYANKPLSVSIFKEFLIKHNYYKE